MNAWPKSQRSPVVLGLTFDGRRIEAVVVRRANQSAEPGPSVTFELPLDPLTGDVAAVARELRTQLDTAGIRERHCVVGLPLEWALTLATLAPDLPPEDLDSLLQLEAERAFPYALDTLALVRLPYGTGLEQGLLQIAIPFERITRLEEVLRAAKLQPESFSLAFPVLAAATAGSADQAVTLAVGAETVSLGIGSGSGFAALRSLAGTFQTTGENPSVRTDAVARELRVTLGQIGTGLRATLQRLRVVGAGPVADRLATELQARAGALGLTVERLTAGGGAGLGLTLPAGRVLTGALALAVRHLTGRPSELEFLPPRQSAWAQFSSRYSSKKVAYAGMAAGVVVAGLLLAFGFQQFQLMSLESEWKGMAGRVREVEDLQGQIKRFRPWFDESYRSLAILRRLTEAFPESGNVTAKSVEIRDGGLVVCSGTARDNAALLKTLDQLRGTSEVTDVQVEQLRGKSPLQFTFNFRWDSAARTP
jgi:hypothetical protein